MDLLKKKRDHKLELRFTEFLIRIRNALLLIGIEIVQLIRVHIHITWYKLHSIAAMDFILYHKYQC